MKKFTIQAIFPKGGKLIFRNVEAPLEEDAIEKIKKLVKETYQCTFHAQEENELVGELSSTDAGHF